MSIKRDKLLERLCLRKHNGMVKVITGLRRVGKSYLLFKLFVEHLLKEGVAQDHIITLQMDNIENIALCEPVALYNHLKAQLKDQQMYYILLDEIQEVKDFEKVLNSLLQLPNADVYVTGSNARFLSKDVLTEFRGRGDEVHIYPLSFTEYLSAQEPTMDRQHLLNDYMQYGGMPQVALMRDVQQKKEYLKGLFLHTYIKDIKERYAIRQAEELDCLMDFVASSIGALTNPMNLQNTFKSVKHSDISLNTIRTYLNMLEDAFLLQKAVRYDIKGKRYLDSPYKYYFTDLGLRNVRINFRQLEPGHMLENVIYNELCRRGFSVDVGQVATREYNNHGKQERSITEVDFVCNQDYKRIYIQSAWDISTTEKLSQEKQSLLYIRDAFEKRIIVGTPINTYQTPEGIKIMNIYDFLLEEE